MKTSAMIYDIVNGLKVPTKDGLYLDIINMEYKKINPFIYNECSDVLKEKETDKKTNQLIENFIFDSINLNIQH